MAATGLVDRHVGFVEALRAAGLPVSLAESLDALRAATSVDMRHRETYRAALAAAMVKRPAHRPAFDRLFDLWWPPAVGDGVVAEADAGAPYGDEGEPGEAGPDGEVDLDALRELLTKLLLDGDEAALRRFAREVVNRLGRADSQPGRQSWFAYRVLRRLSPETLMAELLQQALAGQDRGGLAERIKSFEELIEAEVRRRVAEDKGVESISRTAVKPLVEQVDFLRASRDDILELRRQVHPLARRLATRLAARRRHGHTGRLDFRRTVRASLSTGGVPVVTHHRPHRPHKPELVVLCDVSGSVTAFAHFTVLLAWALREQFTRVRVFAFVDTSDEVTRFFERGADPVDALARMAREADVVWFDGHSDYGHALEVFHERWPDALGPRTSLLILGDARTNYRSLALPTLKTMARQVRHIWWLNPEPRQYWGSGDSAAPAYAEVVPMVECRNAAQLAEFVDGLLPV